MESVGFIIEGGDVGASQYGADSRTLQLQAAPLPLGTGAEKTVQSLHQDKASIIHSVFDGEGCTSFYTSSCTILPVYTVFGCVSTDSRPWECSRYGRRHQTPSLQRNIDIFVLLLHTSAL